MARLDQFEAALAEFAEHGFDASQALGENRARVERVERDHRLERHPELSAVAADHRGQMHQDAPLLGLDLAFEHHQAVVELDRPHRFDEQCLT